MKIEWWKFVPGYDYKYMVSDQGRVLSLNYRRAGIPRLLKPRADEKGYLLVGLCRNGKMKTIKLHRLVAKMFIPNPNNLPEVNHKNEIKTDNRAENLEWCTREYNCNYGTGNERSGRNRINHPAKSKPVSQYNLSCEFVAWYPSMNEARRQTGVKDICSCCRGKLKSAGGFIWRYENRDLY